MHRLKCWLVAVPLLAAFFHLTAATAASTEDPLVAIIGADVLTMTEGGRLERQTVLLSEDRIVAVGPAADVRVPDGARRIDGRGLTLLPGLVDMHMHLAPESGRPGDAAHRAMTVALAHGVTTARSMAGSPQTLEVRRAVEAGELPGPRLYAASPALHVGSTPDADAARGTVAAAAEAGYDLIKSHHLPDPAIWQAVQDEAARHRLATAGHVPNQIGIGRALAAGQQIEHLDGFILELLEEDAPEREVEFGQVPPPPVVMAASRAGDARLAALARRVAAARGHQVPTLALFERVSDVETATETLLADPEMRFVPDPVLRQWAAQRDQFAAQSGYTPEIAASFRALRRRIVGALHEAGVPIMAGSDTAQAFHLWGPGLVREIEALADAGMTPMEALRSATVVPRDYLRGLPDQGSALGWQADFGTVEPGARADLLLVRGDPARDLGALRRIEAVIAAGKVLDRPRLDAMLAAASEAAKGGSPAAARNRHSVYVMRHLATGAGSDPGLSGMGAADARRLVDILANAGIETIFVTDTRRAAETAEPLARALGVTPWLYDPARPDALRSAVENASGSVLIVGHSNTVPDLVARFGGERPGPIAHDAFGTIWRIEPGSPLVREFGVRGRAPAALVPCADPGFPAGTRCGTIPVPEDREQRDGRTIDVHFAVVPSIGPVRDAPLVVLPGGPGLGGVQSGPGTAQLFAGMREGRDLLLIDQRGTGASNRLACAEQQEGQRAADRARACLAELEGRADLAHYATRQAVLDMEAVRAALGYPRLDLFGMSYGTRPALDYLRLFPKRVGEIVIRAPAPVAMKLPLHTARDAQIAFDRLVGACRAQPDCAARHADLGEQLRRLVRRVEREEVRYSIVDPATGEREEKLLTREDLNSALFFLLYIQDFYVQLPPLIDEAARGDFSPMMQAVAPFTGGTVSHIAWGMRWSVICDEDVRRIRREEVAEATRGTFMGASMVEEEIAACALWPAAKIPPDYFEPVASEKPVLILSGELDPVAGRRWGEEIARTLPNSRQVEIRGATHLPPLPGCTGELVESFLDGEPLGGLDLACAEQAERPRLKVGD